MIGLAVVAIVAVLVGIVVCNSLGSRSRSRRRSWRLNKAVKEAKSVSGISLYNLMMTFLCRYQHKFAYSRIRLFGLYSFWS